MPDFFRTGAAHRATDPTATATAIERLTVQDIAVFFQEVLAALPQLVADLSRGGRVVDVHCGGGRWLIAMARRFPELELVGVEFEAGLGRPRAGQRRRRGSRPTASTIRQANGDQARATPASTTSPTSSTPSTSCPTRRGVLRRGLGRAAPGRPDRSCSTGRCRRSPTSSGPATASSSPASSSTSCYQGTALATRERFLRVVRRGRAAEPVLIDLPSGASRLPRRNGRPDGCGPS